MGVAVVSMTSGYTVLRVVGGSYFEIHDVASTPHPYALSLTAKHDFRKRQRPGLMLRVDRDRLQTPPKTSYHEKSKLKHSDSQAITPSHCRRYATGLSASKTCAHHVQDNVCFRLDWRRVPAEQRRQRRRHGDGSAQSQGNGAPPRAHHRRQPVELRAREA